MTTTLTLLDILRSQFPGVEWQIQNGENLLQAIARVSCFCLRYMQTSQGFAFTILCGSVRVFHDDQQKSPEACITEAAKWLTSHTEQCQKAIEENQTMTASPAPDDLTQQLVDQMLVQARLFDPNGNWSLSTTRGGDTGTLEHCLDQLFEHCSAKKLPASYQQIYKHCLETGYVSFNGWTVFYIAAEGESTI